MSPSVTTANTPPEAPVHADPLCNVLPIYNLQNICWTMYSCTYKKAIFLTNKCRKEGYLVTWYFNKANKTANLIIFTTGAKFSIKKTSEKAYTVKETGSLEQGMSFSIRLLLFKAVDCYLEKSFLKEGIIKISNWFYDLHSNANDNFGVAFSFKYFISGESYLCAYIVSKYCKRIQPICSNRFSANASCDIDVVLAPFGYKGRLVNVEKFSKAPDFLRRYREYPHYENYLSLSSSDVTATASVVICERDNITVNFPLCMLFEIENQNRIESTDLNNVHVTEWHESSQKSKCMQTCDGLVTKLANLDIMNSYDVANDINFENSSGSNVIESSPENLDWIELIMSNKNTKNQSHKKNVDCESENIQMEVENVLKELPAPSRKNQNSDLLQNDQIYNDFWTATETLQNANNKPPGSYFKYDKKKELWGNYVSSSVEHATKKSLKNNLLPNNSPENRLIMNGKNEKYISETATNLSNGKTPAKKNIYSPVDIPQIDFSEFNYYKQIKKPSKFITESFSCEKASKLHKIDSEKFRAMMIATSESSILYDHPDSNFLASPVCICENKDEQQQPTNPNLNCKCSFRPQYFRWNVEGRGTHGLSSNCTSYEPRASIQYGESDLNFIFRQFIYIFGSVINPRHFNKASTLENSALFNKELSGHLSNYLKKFPPKTSERQRDKLFEAQIVQLTNYTSTNFSLMLKFFQRSQKILKDLQVSETSPWMSSSSLKISDFCRMDSSKLHYFGCCPLTVYQDEGTASIMPNSIKKWRENSIAPLTPKQNSYYIPIIHHSNLMLKENFFENFFTEFEIMYNSLNLGTILNILDDFGYISDLNQIDTIVELLKNIKQNDSNPRLVVIYIKRKQNPNIIANFLAFLTLLKNRLKQSELDVEIVSEIMPINFLFDQNIDYIRHLCMCIYFNLLKTSSKSTPSRKVTNFCLNRIHTSTAESEKEYQVPYLELPFKVNANYQKFSRSSNQECSVFVSFALTNDEKFIYYAIMDQTGQMIDRRCIEIFADKNNKAMPNQLWIKIGMLRLIINILNFVSVLNKKTHLIFCKIGNYTEAEFVFIAKMLEADNLNKLHLELFDENFDRTRILPLIQSTLIISLEKNPLLSMEEEYYAHFSDQNLFLSKLDQSFGFCIKLSVNLQKIESNVKDDFLDQMASKKFKASSLDIVPELQDEMEVLFQEDMTLTQESDSQDSTQHQMLQNQPESLEKILPDILGALFDYNPQHKAFMLLALKFDDSYQLTQHNMPISLGIFNTPVDEGILPQWMTGPHPNKKNIPIKNEPPGHVELLCSDLSQLKLTNTTFSIQMFKKSVSSARNAQNNYSHPLDENPDKSMIWLMEQFNIQSYLNANFITGNRHNGLPPFILLVMQLLCVHDNIICNFLNTMK